jgi:predicted DNA-binding transcriptional regulator AlpA
MKIVRVPAVSYTAAASGSTLYSVKKQRFTAGVFALPKPRRLRNSGTWLGNTDNCGDKQPWKHGFFIRRNGVHFPNI